MTTETRKEAGVQIVVKKDQPTWMKTLGKRPMYIAMPAIIAVVLWLFVFKKNPPPVQPDPALVGSGSTYGAPANELGDRQRAMIDQHNETAASAAAQEIEAGRNTANVASVYTTAPITAEAETAAPPPPPQPYQPGSNSGSNGSRQPQRIQPRQPDRSVGQYTERLYARWAQTANATTYSTTAPEPSGVEQVQSDNEVDLGLPIGVPLNAILRVGANSDAPGAVVAELDRPRLRLLGEAKRTAPDQVVVTFNSAVAPDGTVYSLEAQALDPETGSPALQGRVKRHILRNLFGTVTGTTVAYLGGYANGVRSNPNSLIGFGFDPSLALRATAAQTVQSAVPAQRPPTVTIDAGTSIQILIVSQPRTNRSRSSTSRPPAQQAAPTDPAAIQVLDAYTTPSPPAAAGNYGYQQ